MLIPIYLQYGWDPFCDRIVDGNNKSAKLDLIERWYALEKLAKDADADIALAAKQKLESLAQPPEGASKDGNVQTGLL